MWYTLQDREPEIGMHIIWVINKMNNSEFPEFAYYYEGEWWISGRNITENWWKFIAWFDLPPYERA